VLRQRLQVIVVDGIPGTSRARATNRSSKAGLSSRICPTVPTGLDFAYSSGTTGRPKGIKQRMTGEAQMAKVLAGDWLGFFNLSPESVYLSPAPLYHAAPLRFSMRSLASGAQSS
jgi:acyl-CoA synthetase (AMP-forming)/AMP-acid ligase II